MQRVLLVGAGKIGGEGVAAEEIVRDAPDEPLGLRLRFPVERLEWIFLHQGHRKDLRQMIFYNTMGAAST